jgi:hypothetical protein
VIADAMLASRSAPDRQAETRRIARSEPTSAGRARARLYMEVQS